MDIFGKENSEQRAELLAEARDLSPKWVAYANMGSFASSTPEAQEEPHALYTFGAYPCTIIAIMLRDHRGALGHLDSGPYVLRNGRRYFADAVRNMLTSLGCVDTETGEEIDEIVMIAGDFSDDPYSYGYQENPSFTERQELLSGEFSCPVRWAHFDQEQGVMYEFYDSALLLPHRRSLLLFTSEEGRSTSGLSRSEGQLATNRY